MTNGLRAKISLYRLATMKIPNVAQGCHLGNQAEFVLGPHMSINLQKKLHWNRHF